MHFIKTLLLALVALPAVLANCSDDTDYTWKYTHGTTKYTHHCSFLSNGDAAKNAKRRNNWCPQVKKYCKKSCDNCGSNDGGCKENTTWRDSKHNKCSFYSSKSKCKSYAEKYKRHNGVSAYDKCCKCKNMADKAFDDLKEEAAAAVAKVEAKTQALKADVGSCKDSTSYSWTYTHGTTKYTLHCSFLSNGDAAKNAKRRNNWCPKVKKYCKKSCDNCGSDDNGSDDEGKCTDTKKNWKDVKGYGCDWYNHSRCAQFGHRRFNDGGKANDYCCVCGGGKHTFMEA